MIISPWVLGFSDVSLAKWCNVLIGLALVIMATWTMSRVAPVAPAVGEELKKERSHKHNVEQK